VLPALHRRRRLALLPCAWQDAPAALGRGGSRRRAAQAGQARAAAMAVALAEESDGETARAADTPGFEAPARKPLGGAAAAAVDGHGDSATEQPHAATAGALADSGAREGAGEAAGTSAAGPAAPAPRARGGGKGAGKGTKQAPEPPAPASHAPAAAAAGAEAAEAAHELAEEQPDVDMVPATQDADAGALAASQPATQPQPAQPQPRAAAAAAPAGGSLLRAGGSQMSVSLFSQALGQYEPRMAANPLAALNMRCGRLQKAPQPVRNV
jgi:hypothetical protein